VTLSICNDESFDDIGTVYFSDCELAYAFCLGRLVGSFTRNLPRGIKKVYEPRPDEVNSSFTLVERTDGKCDSKISVKTDVAMAEYGNIGHFGLFGIMHIVETIHRDIHLSMGERANIAMFEHEDKMYRVRSFDKLMPEVYGMSIMDSRNFNYHVEPITFYEFGTVVKLGRRYYLDGMIIGGPGVSSGGDTDDSILAWVAQNYPSASKYIFDTGSGCLL
jgi:hypothetical protein